MHDDKRKRLAANVFFPVGVVLFTGFALADLFVDGPCFGVLFKFIMAIVIALNFLLYFKGLLSIDRHSDLVLTIMTLVMIYLVMYGAPGRGGALWLLVFPLVAFFIKGPRSGLLWSIANCLCVGVLCFLSRLNIISLDHYQCHELAAMILPFIAICSLTFLYEYYSCDYRKKLLLSERFAEENKRFSYQVELARQVQMQIVPSNDVFTDFYEASFFYEPAYRIGGDYIDYFDINDNIAAFVLCDVVGKGIPAALLMMSLRTLILSFINNGKTDPHEIIQSANTMFHDDYKDDFYVTLSFILFEKKTKLVHFYNAGHSPFIYFSKVENRIKEIELEAAPIGLFKKGPKAISVDLQMYSDDIIILFSDGLTDRINIRDLKNARAKLFTLVQENSEKSSSELKEIISSSCRRFDDNSDYKDDISFVIIKIL